MSASYIKNHFDNIIKYANVVENRLDDSYITIDNLLKDNKYMLDNVIKYKLKYILIDNEYKINI